MWHKGRIGWLTFKEVFPSIITRRNSVFDRIVTWNSVMTKPLCEWHRWTIYRYRSETELRMESLLLGLPAILVTVFPPRYMFIIQSQYRPQNREELRLTSYLAYDTCKGINVTESSFHQLNWTPQPHEGAENHLIEEAKADRTWRLALWHHGTHIQRAIWKAWAALSDSKGALAA